MDLLQQLAGGRIVAGAATWLAPGMMGKVAGVADVPEAHLSARLFGARDLALGLGTLAFNGETRTALVRLGILCDALDCAAAVVGAKQGTLPKRRGAGMATIAAGAVVMGAVAARA